MPEAKVTKTKTFIVQVRSDSNPPVHEYELRDLIESEPRIEVIDITEQKDSDETIPRSTPKSNVRKSKRR